MEELFSFIVFFLIMAFIIFRQWLIDRQNRKKREEERRQKPAYQSSQSEPVEPTAFYESHRIKPIPPATPELVQKVETPPEVQPRYGFENNIDGRELAALLQERHLTTDLGSFETSELVSDRFAGEYKELTSPVDLMPASRIGSLLQSQKSIKDVILLSEILKNPYI